MKSKQTILCITYGGIHPHLTAPIINEISNNYNIVVLALTSAKKIYNEYGIKTMSVLDFMEKTDRNAIKYGNELLSEMKKNGDKVINEHETIAYLGLSFNDLIEESGNYCKAKSAYSHHGRKIFNPKTLITRVFKKIKPDLLLTTNSPRAEKIATFIAKKNSIPSILITDRFCQHEHYKFIADVICVTDQQSKENLIKIQGIEERKIYITGNPFFDKFTNNRLKTTIHKKNKSRVFLWIDQSSYLSGETYTRYWRSDQEIIKHIETLSNILSKESIELIVRPHPSQAINIYQDLVKRNVCSLSVDEDIMTISQASDFVGGYTSTALIATYNLGKPVFVFNPLQEKSYLPITYKPCVFEIKDYARLKGCIKNSRINCKSHIDPIGSINGDSVTSISKIISSNLSLDI